MPNIYRPKKPARKDWHPADVKAALEKSGWTLRRLSVAHGYAAKSLAAALNRRWLAAERIIATAIGAEPEIIWPSRYIDPRRGQSHRSTAAAQNNTGSNDSSAARQRNVRARRAA